MTALFTGYVGALLDEAAANPAGAWQAKDCAIYLVTALVGPAGRWPEVRLPHMLVFLAGCYPMSSGVISLLHHPGVCKLIANAR